MTIKIATDASMDLPKHFIKRYNIQVVPMTVNLGEQRYSVPDGVESNYLYQKMEEKNIIPSTSQPTLGDFYQIYKEATDDGSSLIAIHVSKKISGVYQAGKLAQKKLPDRDIEVIDSHTATLCQGILVLIAAQMAEKGKGKEEIIQKIKELRSKAIVFATLNDLDTLYHSGRVNLTQKLLARLFNFKPIFWLIEGDVKGAGRIRGQKNLLQKLNEFGQKICENLAVKIFFVIHSNRKEEAEKMAQYLREQTENVQIEVGEFGLVAGAHTGPGLLGYAWIGEFNPQWFFKKKKRYRAYKKMTDPERIDYKPF
ncbi:MAG: DegV family EDD domain-containing protein [Candidatus Heimdallarchaeota archaeon]|nr:DegV family EDD domain-containing protein [Candidatus Heimdallarchaeota archaeon]